MEDKFPKYFQTGRVELDTLDDMAKDYPYAAAYVKVKVNSQIKEDAVDFAIAKNQTERRFDFTSYDLHRNR